MVELLRRELRTRRWRWGDNGDALSPTQQFKSLESVLSFLRGVRDHDRAPAEYKFDAQNSSGT